MGFYRTWFLRSLRLAPVVGLAAAGWHSWVVFKRYDQDVQAQARLETTYRCAARLSDKVLAAGQNAYGNINVRDACQTERDFFVSRQELKDVRAGTMRFETLYHASDWQGAAIAGTAWAIFTILTSLLLISVIAIGRWIWGPPGVARGESSRPP